MIRKLILAFLGVCILAFVVLAVGLWGFRHGYWPNAGIEDPSFNDALLFHQGVFGLLVDRRLAQARMRENLFFLPTDSKRFEARLAQIREVFARERLPAEFRELFEAEVIWHRQLHQRDPDAVYEESRTYKARYESCLETSYLPCSAHRTIARKLAEIAADRGHLRAEFDFVQSMIESDPDEPYGHSVGLRLLADKDYLPAQLDLADRYRTGRRVKQDIRQAYYWYGRARDNGGDVADRLAELETQLTSEMRRRISWCFSSESFCISWEDELQCLDVGRCPLDE